MQCGEELIWERKFADSSPVLAVSSVDLTSDGYEDIILCKWDGTTYIVSVDGDVAVFEFPDKVFAFAAGMLSISLFLRLQEIIPSFLGRMLLYLYM